MRFLSIATAVLLVLGFMVGPGLAGEASLLSDDQLAEISGAILDFDIDTRTQDVSGLTDANGMNIIVAQKSKVAGQVNVVAVEGTGLALSITQTNTVGF